MGAEIIETTGKLVTIKMWDLLKPAEQTHVQRSLASFLQRTEHAQILMDAAEFKGWEATPEWGNLSISFPLRVDSKIERMALLAEGSREEDLLAFFGEGHREFPIRRFDPEERSAAMKWLETGEDV